MLAFVIILVYDTFPKMSISKFPFTYNSVLQGKRLQSTGKDFCPARRDQRAASNAIPAGSRRIFLSNNHDSLAAPNAMPAGSRKIFLSNNRDSLAPPNDTRERAP